MVGMEVLNVGDGACSRVHAGPSLAVLDCGSWGSTSGRAPANVLASALGARLADLDTLIVSHFDADHWKGLHHLAKIVRGIRRPHGWPRTDLERIPFFRASAACWWARTTVESIEMTHSSSPTASSLTIAACRILSQVPSAVHFRMSDALLTRERGV